jgi:hypothetical protein
MAGNALTPRIGFPFEEIAPPKSGASAAMQPLGENRAFDRL